MSDAPMRLRHIRTIAWKELVDFVRDWRTLVAVIVIPLLIFPLLFFALPMVLQMEAAERGAMELDIIIQGDEPGDVLRELFSADKLNISIEALPGEIGIDLSVPLNDSEVIKRGDAQAILRMLHPSVAQNLTDSYVHLVGSPSD